MKPFHPFEPNMNAAEMTGQTALEVVIIVLASLVVVLVGAGVFATVGMMLGVS